MISLFFISLLASQVIAFSPSKDLFPSRIQKINFDTSISQRNGPILYQSEWADFADLEDDEDDYLEDLGPPGKMKGFADENDPQELKAEIGSSIEGPELDWFGEPLFLPQGSVVPLTEENVQAILAACREEIGTMFGYSAENRGVGITGGVDFVELDGPCVVVRLKGRYWHQRYTVLDRVGSYLQGRIPEIVDIMVEDEWQLTDEANNMAD
jgi:hypothetical protein